MLNKIPVFKGINYERLSYSGLEAEILAMADLGWKIHDLGYSSDENKKLYGISLGDLENKQVLYFHAQIHGGHEWQTSHWALQFCREIVNTENPYHKEAFNILKQKYAIYVIPCVNPYGYDPETSSYANANGVAIDANFDYTGWVQDVPYYSAGPHPFSEPESQAIKNVFDAYKPLSLICCHTHGGYNGVAIRPNTAYKYEMLMRHGIKSAIISTDNWHPDGGEIAYLSRQSAYNWAATQTSSFGLPIPGGALEPGSEETDFDKSVLGMTALLCLLMQLDKYYSTMTQ